MEINPFKKLKRVPLEKNFVGRSIISRFVSNCALLLPVRLSNGVKIIRSTKRKRTVSARVVNDEMLVYAPRNIAETHLAKIIDKFKLKFERKKIKQELSRKQDLSEIFQKLNAKYFSGKLEVNSIEYSTRQNGKFGCCNFRQKTILISHRLGSMPEWVRDYVVVHEMAHLIEPNHSKAFWDIVTRYKLAERAKGYLMATGFQAEDNFDTGQDKFGITA